MTTIVRVAALVWLVLTTTACGSGSGQLDLDTDRAPVESRDPPEATAEQACRANLPRLRALTYNTALAPAFEPLALDRAPKVIEALADAAEDLDVMCVQELWLEEHFDALRASVSELPYVLRMTPRPGTGGCTETELEPLAACLVTSCPGAEGDQLIGCAQAACPDRVAALSSGCLGCVLDHLESFSTCLGKAEEPSDPAVFGGAFEVAFMSRWPIVHAELRELSSYFVRASALHARVAVPRRGLVDVYCTHLGSELGLVPYAGKFGSFEGEHLQQVNEVVAFVKTTNRGRPPLLLMGDFNMGPAVPGNSASNASHYDRLVRAFALDDVTVTGDVPPCTLCAGTTFRGPTATNEIVDHVFSKRLPTHNATQERLFTDPVALGDDLPMFNLSDHRAVKIVF